MFSATDIERIDETALRLLSDPGVRLEHDGVIARLLAAGAQPGHDAQVVRLPRAMVHERIALAPRVIQLADMNGQITEVAAGGPSLFWTGAALNWADLAGRCSPITSDLLADWARLVDTLGSVHGIVGTALEDVPPRGRDFVGLRIMAENCRKHLRALSFSPLGAEAMKEMVTVLAGGSLRNRPLFSMGFTAHGPLRWTHLALDIFVRSAGAGIPVMVNGEPMAGASAPVTLAGEAAVGHAEILAGIVVNEVLEPGRPVIHNLGFSHIMDMRTAIAVTGGAETCLLAAVGAALARRHGLPSASWMCTDAMIPDEQAAAESMLAAVTHAAAGVNVIWGVGQLESEKTISPAKAVMDDEIVAIARRFVRGVEVNDETLAEELVRQVGIAGQFLDSEHTLDRFRGELHQPRLLCRVPRDRWKSEGSRSFARRAAERAGELLAASRPPLLNPAVSGELARIEAHYLKAIQ
jgi:trimethylamine--corrinoid protein Co-methyltransferase